MHPSTGRCSRFGGYSAVLILPVVAWVLLPAQSPRWVWMWSLALGIYAGCKWLTWWQATRVTAVTATALRSASYLLAWPGLDATAFLSDRSSKKPTHGEWLFAALKLAFGLALFWGARWIVPHSRTLLLGWAGMIGTIFILHFGTFHLLSCAWRWRGVDARPLMNWPIKSTSLSEFWGRRWNTAFRDLAYRFLFRPLQSVLGASWAVLIGFLFSGIVHDLVISLPAGGGYGGPTVYFLLQAVGLLAERSSPASRFGLRNGWAGWLSTFVVVAAPAGLLFHPTFVHQIVLPFMTAMGAA